MSVLTTDEVLASFEGIQTVAICAHVNPDGDALGSMLALASLLRQKGCEVTCLLAQDRPAPGLYSFLENYDFVSACAYTDTPDLFIAVDVPALSRLGDGEAVFNRALRSLCIDHHPNYSGFADAYYGDDTAAATGTLIWSIIKASGANITPAMASYCYVAVMTDTGRFSYQNTSERTFCDAAEMVACGVDPTLMSQCVYEDKSLAVVKLESRLIERMKFSHQNRVVCSWVNEQDFEELGVSRDDTEGLPTILRSIAGVEVAALLRAEEGVVRVNLRSRGTCDVGQVAQNFGGGGHRAAAGITFETTLEKSIELLLGALDEIPCLNETTDESVAAAYES
ncbi:MAG: DHH family phosphoesterase [Coriobacteriales bacterium]|nr:DHH family phosphoesterase [Coriobacteriales bacterium]